MRRHVGTAVAVSLCLASLGFATDGLRAFTAEGARRVDVVRRPRALPPLRLVDHSGRAFTLADLPGERVFVELVFTRCTSICRVTTYQFARAAASGTRDASFLSITFDPGFDTVPRLAQHAARVGADGTRWRFARVANRALLAELLDRLGVVVIPDGLGGFEHNAAIHELDARRRLVAIHDLEDFPG